MSILAWILFGFLAGAAAKLVTPGKHPQGCIVSIALGIAGAVMGGFAGIVLFGERVGWSFSLKPFLIAVLGSIVVLLLLQAIEGRQRR
ncbi:MAG: GlsB/YeaQ/YmgE family stress response membrane protein [Gaiellaceae bacterium]